MKLVPLGRNSMNLHKVESSSNFLVFQFVLVMCWGRVARPPQVTNSELEQLIALCQCSNMCLLCVSDEVVLTRAARPPV
uniref:Uncharacterized protein n=1 Tax=Arundo donax TaxID=35708 RepID=A0A0A8ZSU8_ARUDO